MWLGGLCLEKSTHLFFGIIQKVLPVEMSIGSSLKLGKLRWSWASLSLHKSFDSFLGIIQKLVPVELGVSLSLGISLESRGGFSGFLGHSLPVDVRSLGLSELSS